MTLKGKWKLAITLNLTVNKGKMMNEKEKIEFEKLEKQIEDCAAERESDMNEFKFILANLLEIERKILKKYDFDKDKAKEHTGYKEVEALSIEITEIIKKEEEKEIINNSFIL